MQSAKKIEILFCNLMKHKNSHLGEINFKYKVKMSYNKTKCCNVCKKAGKPRSVFGSHFPKDSAGRTVCPTLLGDRCGFHCKVCKVSGKPESIVTSHNVKDKTGKVCCPTLLGQACSKCGNLGHTINYCKSEKEWREKFDDKEDRRMARVRREEVKVPNKPSTSAFSALDLSDSEEEEEHTKAEIEMKRDHADTISLSLSPNVTLRPHQKGATFSEKHAAMMRSFKNGTLNWADVDSDSDEDA